MDTRFSPAGSHNDIALTRSTDGGRTWSPAIKVNSTPAALTGHNGHAFTPWVHVLSDGTVGVSYYDFRFNDPTTGGTDTDHWLVHCHASSEDCSLASSWDEEVRVTPQSFDSRQAPVARGFFLGDYVGLDDDGTRFAAFFAEGVSPANPTDIFYSEVTPESPQGPASAPPTGHPPVSGKTGDVSPRLFELPLRRGRALPARRRA
jgi:hypothetical protein